MANARWRSCLLAASCLAAPLAAQAPVEPAPQASGVLVFDPEFFAGSSPSDALDMIERLPGFTLVDVDEEVRGLSGARGNILFDGKAPASKESLEDMLQRIPAKSVARIELIREGAVGFDMGGFAVIANVVRKREVSRRASIEAGAAIADDGMPRPEINAEASTQSGNKRFEAGVALEDELDDESGEGRILVEEDGETERLDRSEREITRLLSAQAEYETVFAGGELTASGSASRERNRERVETVSALEPDDREIARERETLTSFEGSARYRRDVGRGARADGLLLHRAGRLRLLSTEEEGEDFERFSEARETSETVVRLSLRRERPGLALEASAEAALNSLSSDVTLEENGEAVELPGSRARVEERRGEASLGAVWSPRPGFTLDGAIRAEASTIESAGDAPSRRSFFYLKPRLAAAIALGGSDQLRLSVQRDVGQLDFADFVASATLDRDEVSAGALSLRPPQSWSVLAEYEHRFWGEGALTLSYRHEWLSDVVDRVTVTVDGEIFDAVGNIGDGVRHTGKLDLSAPLSRIGLRGFLLRASIIARVSRVTDPVTGLRRIISEDLPVEGEIALTQDLMDGKLSWGVEITLPERERRFRFDEVRSETDALQVGAHVEYRPADDWRLKLEAENITGRAIGDRREEYDGLRSLGLLDSVERRRIETSPRLVFSVQKSFE